MWRRGGQIRKGIGGKKGDEGDVGGGGGGRCTWEGWVGADLGRCVGGLWWVRWC